MKKIVIAGGTGFIGSALVELLKPCYSIFILTRNPEKYKSNENLNYLKWDGVSPIPDILNDKDVIINLAGENIGGKRWSVKQKQRIVNSRITASEAIVESIKQAQQKPTLLIQASASGYYGQYQGTNFTEHSPLASNSFLASVCDKWEKAAASVNIDGVRVAIIRTGIVLGSKGLFEQVNIPFNFFAGTIIGNGKQHLPWIHIDDEISAIQYIIENDSLSGVINLCSPNSCSMAELVKAIAKARKRPAWFKVPKFGLQLIFGKEMTEELILSSQIVLPTKLQKANYKFNYNDVNEAVKAIVNADL